MIKECVSIEQEGWLALREALWPHGSRSEHLAEMVQQLAEPKRFVQFVAYSENGSPVGLAEASLRSDYVNGTESSPVAFLEGIYVVPNYRRQGIARELVVAVSQWAVSRGCRELASDAALENELSQTVHKMLGFAETERVVYFRKGLTPE